MSEMQKLLERVRAAEGPDRELDAFLCEAFDLPKCQEPDCLPDVLRRIIDCVKVTHDEDPDVPFYTSSIDSALALVERLLPGWQWLVRSASKDGKCFARLESPDFADVVWEAGDKETRDIIRGEEALGKAATPPIAILAALLSALLAPARLSPSRSEVPKGGCISK